MFSFGLASSFLRYAGRPETSIRALGGMSKFSRGGPINTILAQGSRISREPFYARALPCLGETIDFDPTGGRGIGSR